MDKENKEQTAVEQFVKRVESISNNRTLTKQESIQLYNQAIEQAKEMEKEQKATTWNNAIDAELKNKWESFEQFHNETYE
jgi:type IV secretory pathway TrbF-like protein